MMDAESQQPLHEFWLRERVPERDGWLRLRFFYLKPFKTRTGCFVYNICPECHEKDSILRMTTEGQFWQFVRLFELEKELIKP